LRARISEGGGCNKETRITASATIPKAGTARRTLSMIAAPTRFDHEASV